MSNFFCFLIIVLVVEMIGEPIATIVRSYRRK